MATNHKKIALDYKKLEPSVKKDYQDQANYLKNLYQEQLQEYSQATGKKEKNLRINDTETLLEKKNQKEDKIT